MAFPSPSNTSVRVKPVPPPKPFSPTSKSSLKLEGPCVQKGECQQVFRGEKSAAIPVAGGVKCVKPHQQPNQQDGKEDSSGGAVENHQTTPTTRTSALCSTDPLILRRIPPEDRSGAQNKLSCGGTSSSKSPLATKFPDPFPQGGVVDNTKPPLLPKPSSIGIRNPPKPPIPKRPDVSSFIRRTIQDIGTQTPPFGKPSGNKQEALEKLTISRSTVTGFHSFEKTTYKGGSSNPVRPPRSPKNKPFTGMPFDFLNSKQNLSPSQKILSLPHAERQKSFLWSLRQCDSRGFGAKDESLSLVEAKVKSCSLERNTTLFPSEHASIRAGIRCKNPIPPPRRGKKKSPTNVEPNPFLSLCSTENNNFPVYAVVNYELKKNRRLQGDTGVKTSATISSQETSAASDALSPSIECSNPVESETLDQVKCSFNSQLFGEAVRCEGHGTCCRIAQESECGCEQEGCVRNGSEELQVIGRDLEWARKDEVTASLGSCSLPASLESACSHCEQFVSASYLCKLWETQGKVTDGTVTSARNDDVVGKYVSVSSSVKEFSEEQTKEVDPEMVKEASVPVCIKKDLVSQGEFDLSSKIPCLSSDSCKLNHETQTIIGTKVIGEAGVTDCDQLFVEEENSKVVEVADEDIGESEFDHSSKSTLVAAVEQSTFSPELSPLPINLSSQGGESLRKTSSESDCSPWADAVESKRSDEDDDDLEFQRNQNSTLPMRSKLNASHVGSNDQNRRQSWSDGQKKENSSSSWSSVCKQRRKRRGRSLWCDEGDLSSGTLGDQSSFEDVPVDDKSGETSSTCRRFSALFSSFGKNSRKSHSVGHKQKEKKNRGVSKFYCDPHDGGKHLRLGRPAVDVKGPDPSIEHIHSSSKTEREEVKEMDEEGGKAEMDSGVSMLCTKVDSLNLKRQSGEFGSGSYISEQSFDIAPSESENEEMSLPEEKLETSLSEKQSKEEKRFYIAKELMSSEGVFVDTLRLLCRDFPTAVSNAGMEQKTEIISKADLCKILNNLPQLLRFNEDLLHDLEERISNWNSSQKISDIIVRKGPFLKLYTSYFQNYMTQGQYLRDLCSSNARFQRVVHNFEASPRCQKLALEHHMLKPIQRLPQYRLLLEAYLAELDPESTDYDDTKVALDIVCDVADHANRSMKQGDAKLLQLQSLLKNYAIIKPGRTFLKEGELQKLCRKGMQNRYFILLNDCLLYAAYDRSVQSPGSLKVNNELPLNGMKVEIPVAEDYANEFSVISITRSFTLSASSAQERSEWVNALLRAIQDYTSRQQTFLQMKLDQNRTNQKENEHFQLGMAAPVWIQDCRVTMCQSCTSEFTVTFRRHHCRACGKVVCGNCSANKAPLQYKKFQAARVCDECYESLLQDFEKNVGTQEAFRREHGSQGNVDAASGSIRASFKKLGPPAAGKKIKSVPQRLKEVCAKDSDSQMSGWLHWKYRRSWKKMWFVLKGQVLYVYKASEDVIALQSIPILGYQVLPCEVESMKEEEVDTGVAFSLTHKGKQFLEFQADNVNSSKRWISAMQEATVLK